MGVVCAVLGFAAGLAADRAIQARGAHHGGAAQVPSAECASIGDIEHLLDAQRRSLAAVTRDEHALTRTFVDDQLRGATLGPPTDPTEPGGVEPEAPDADASDLDAERRAADLRVDSELEAVLESSRRVGRWTAGDRERFSELLRVASAETRERRLGELLTAMNAGRLSIEVDGPPVL